MRSAVKVPAAAVATATEVNPCDRLHEQTSTCGILTLYHAMHQLRRGGRRGVYGEVASAAARCSLLQYGGTYIHGSSIYILGTRIHGSSPFRVRIYTALALSGYVYTRP